MSKKVVYTSIFGNFDKVEKSLLPKGWEFKIFNESNSIPLYKDNNRNAKKYKLLPHRYLNDYEYSLWIDGNFKVIGNIEPFIEKYLSNANIAFFNHKNTSLDPRNCIYQEANAIFHFGQINMQRSPERGLLNYKDNPEIIKNQVIRYQNEGYPPNNGLIKGGIILRRHNSPDVIDAMEAWWEEVKYNSKRDQLSFNYIAWKHKLKFNYIDGDLRNNEFFSHTSHTGKK
tara:strand:+ start:1295 stop:1978 length:684 start_codon:yes stop_codon:yes gene_type:complete